MELKSSKRSLTLLKQSLTSSENITVKYHDIFDYKLTKAEAIKWQYKNFKVKVSGIKNKKRLLNEKYSKEKLILARKAAKVLAMIPTVKFVGITGALAMNNAGKDSDIDLMVITEANTLWLTRMSAYIFLKLSKYSIRKPKDREQANMLCINLWLDEQDLVWSKNDRNIYTAHEIAQVVPLVNKDETFEKFLHENMWVLNYWPKAVVIRKLKYKKILHKDSFFEELLFKLQYLYMKRKITREAVTLKRAVFHPNDWGKVVLNKLSS